METMMLEADGHRVRLAIEADGWLAAETPLTGSSEALLGQQLHMPGLAKVAAGPSLRAELPVDGSIERGIAALREAMQAGLAVLDGRAAACPSAAHQEDRAREVLAAYAPPAHVSDWTCDGALWRCRVETSRGLQRVVARIERGGVRIATDLARLRRQQLICLRALAHFLLALNRRLRLARGSLDRDAVRLEVVLPADGLEPSLIDRALGALAVGATHAKRECAALLEPALAAHYYAIHVEQPSPQPVQPTRRSLP